MTASSTVSPSRNVISLLLSVYPFLLSSSPFSISFVCSLIELVEPELNTDCLLPHTPSHLDLPVLVLFSFRPSFELRLVLFFASLPFLHPSLWTVATVRSRPSSAYPKSSGSSADVHRQSAIPSRKVAGRWSTSILFFPGHPFFSFLIAAAICPGSRNNTRQCLRL